MFKDRIFSPSTITALALLFLFTTVRVEQAARQDLYWVLLPVTVTDVSGFLVTGLDRHHFEVFEDKVK